MPLFTTLAQGNPGAVSVMSQMLDHGDTIDRDSASGSLMAILHLDSLDIHGSDIWVLYKDVCDQDIHKLFILIRATQLGFVSHSAIKSMRPLDPQVWVDIAHKVYDALDNFQHHPTLLPQEPEPAQ